MIDFSKAFNRQDHNILLTLLCDLVASFLKGREIILNFQGYTAKSRKLTGGGPQGTIIGMFLFIVVINLIGFGNQRIHIGKTITKPLNSRKPLETIHLKFIDDFSVAESLNLKEKLVHKKDNSLSRPLEYHNRTEHVLPESESKVQGLLNAIVEYTTNHKMKINNEKSKVMLFNSSTKFDFNPKLSLVNGTNLSLVENYQLLGVIIQSNMKWDLNTNYICGKAYDRIWMIRRLKALGATCSELVDVYNKQVRCVLEMAAPVWTPALTKCQVTQIERVQKTVCAVILGSSYCDYSSAMKTLNLSSLSDRRVELCTTFSKRCYKSKKYNTWFVERGNQSIKTRSKKNTLLPVLTRTSRYEKSPLPYMTALLLNL